MELPACPVETTLMLIGDKWKVLILRDLMSGTKRFGELKKSIGHVTQKVLTAQLCDMEAKRPAHAQGLRRGTAARGIYPDRYRLQPAAHPRLYGGLGHGLSEAKRRRNMRSIRRPARPRSPQRSPARRSLGAIP